ncbi:cytochrome P450 [Nocardia sp. NPDC050435]|uniref:cytochrome P450 n=1 Tax=Nocardia sp. NPDC050435 TaxID=3155040 RepID=UPI0033E0DE1A
MTDSPTAAPTTTTPGSPADTEEPRIALYSEEYAADPRRAHAEMRARYGALAPVELAPGVVATLVLDYEVARTILHDPQRFPADPRRWQATIAPDCPIRPMLEWRPNALRSDGYEHSRYRQPTTAALAAIDMYALHATVETLAAHQIECFGYQGRADLISDYAHPLAFAVLNSMLGCPPRIGQHVATGVRAMFNSGPDAAAGSRLFEGALRDLVDLKRATPGGDVTSRMLAHPHQLDDTEMVHQLVTIYAAGIEPLVYLIVNTLLLMLTDDRFGGHLLAGSLSTREALDEVLSNNPPLANYCISYPRHPIMIEGQWLPADQPVIIGMAACNTDPKVNQGSRYNASHLAFSAGPHSCPAASVSHLIAIEAIDQLLDKLPEMRLTRPVGELVWRPGPFHRALTELPVTFPTLTPVRQK